MKTSNLIRGLYLVISISFFSLSLTAQTYSVIEINKILDNWSHLHDKGDYQRAIRQAELAFKSAESLGEKEMMARALNREGQSLLKTKKRQKKNRKLAKEKFERSLFYLASIENTKLRIENLEGLKSIAKINNEQQLILYYDKQIKEINDLIDKRNNNELLIEKKEVLEQQLVQLDVQKEVLSNKVKSLTAAQLKSELLIVMQKNQVDSFRYERVMDSFLLAQKELMLSEQSSKLELQKSHIDRITR